MSIPASLKPLTIGDFTEFYSAAHDHKRPFAWQERLAEQACLGQWPDYVKLPTSSGKTAAIDIAVFALAFQACAANRPNGILTAARRIFFVVDRRIIVNEAYRQTRRTAEVLWNAVAADAPDTSSILWRVAAWLRSVANSASAPPLDCFELRGGIYRDDAWVRSPLQPTVLTSTVDQVGSRMLFRGYGVSDRNLPIHAAMTTCDSLIILDEVHCSNPFRQTVEAIARYRGEHWAEEPLASPFSLVQMTATPPQQLGDKSLFTLNDHDYEVDELLEKRHACSKPITLDRDTAAKGKSLPSKLAASLVKHAHALAEAGCKKIAIVVNRVAIAREAFKLLDAKHGKSASLMIGRMRPIDREQLTTELQQKFGSGVDVTFDEPQFVVATQCLEVGADLDFDGMVSQCASLDALRQRFGRLNRLGNAPHARGVIVAAEGDVQPEDKLSDDKPLDPVYGNALARTWLWLNDVMDERGEVDFGIKPFDALLRQHDPDLVRLAAPSPDATVLMPAHLDMLCQTSPRPALEPDIAAYLHGPQPPRAEVLVCWRADLDVHATVDRTNSWSKAVAVCPPTSIECLSVPLFLVKKWLRGESLIDTTSDVLGEIEEEESPSKTKADSHGRCGLVWKGQPKRTSHRRKMGEANVRSESSFVVHGGNLDRLRPNSTLVLPAEFGGWHCFGHIPNAPSEPDPDAWRQAGNESREHASDSANEAARIDVADQAFSQSQARAILRVHPKLSPMDCVRELFDALLPLVSNQEADINAEWKATTAAIQQSENADESERADSWASWIALHRRRLLTIAGTPTRYPAGIAWTTKLDTKNLPGMPRLRLASFGDDEDSLSETGRLSLIKHLADVFAEATRIAEASSLPEPLQNAITTAAKLHDIGKVDPRFQALLLGKPVSVAQMQRTLWAKSDSLGGPKTGELPTGFRHEMLSVDLLHRFDDGSVGERELLAHVVAAHHGYARPLAPVSVDESLPGFNLDAFRATAVSHDERANWKPSYRLDSGIAERFWTMNRRFGWWGVAYLESMLRLADWAASASPNQGDVTAFALSTPSATDSAAAPTIDRHEIVLTGIDGSRPLGFLAALGTFRTLGDGPDGATLRFSWRCQQGAWRPVISSSGNESFDQESLVEVLMQKLACKSEHPSLRLADLVTTGEQSNTRRETFQRIAANSSLQDRGDAEWMSCNGSDAAIPKAISQLQTSRRDNHPKAIIRLLRETTSEHLTRTLFAAWDYADPTDGVSLHLEPREDRRHAYQWHTPSGDPTRKTSGGMIGANRLALEAWPWFQSLAAGDRLRTVGFRGTRVSGTCLTWPIWNVPVAGAVIPTLLSHRGVQGADFDRDQILPIGIPTVYQCQRILVGKTPNLTSAKAVLT
ncbi:MAG: type I-U CRISPR-associated helicase/endonuclease Cas3 [Planctomycetaceae bacterium]|nr:type I-U CRISPR-associated helicase/endonuclease Cas3 [Planctomycetaceae bacterium]